MQNLSRQRRLLRDAYPNVRLIVLDSELLAAHENVFHPGSSVRQPLNEPTAGVGDRLHRQDCTDD
jgi:hypothetical protein